MKQRAKYSPELMARLGRLRALIADPKLSPEDWLPDVLRRMAVLHESASMYKASLEHQHQAQMRAFVESLVPVPRREPREQQAAEQDLDLALRRREGKALLREREGLNGSNGRGKNTTRTN